MKERPILFSAPMVRAILSGQKTMTRRVVTPQPSGKDINSNLDGKWLAKKFDGLILPRIEDLPIESPFGQPGDRLWVRENFSGGHSLLLKNIPPKNWSADTRIWYWADGERGAGETTRIYPSMHLPRKFSRITLEITGVKVERLNQISNTDILREGVRSESCNICVHTGGSGCDHCFSIIKPFRVLWDSINGKTTGKTWDDNPFVWVVSFRRV